MVVVTRLVVVSPHPDDEVLMAGGLMPRLSIRDDVLVRPASWRWR